MAHYFRPIIDANYSDITKGGASSASWSVSGTVATVTATLNSLATGDIIAITNSTGTTDIPNGDYAVTAIGSGTFSFTCPGGGSGSGTADWTAYVWYDAASSGNKQSSKPSSSDAVTITRQFCALSGHEAAASVTIDAGLKLSMSTFNLDMAGALTVNGTHSMGASSGTGLTCAGISFSGTTTRDWDASAVINNAGNYSVGGTCASVVSRGKYTQTENGTFSSLSPNGTVRAFTLDNGKTLTIGANGTYITDIASDFTVINGTLGVGTYVATIGAKSTGYITFGANSDVTGSGYLMFYAIYGCAFTNLKTAAFSITGKAYIRTASATNNLVMPAWDFSNAEVGIIGANVANYNRYILSGTLKCKTLRIAAYSTTPYKVHCSDNPNMSVTNAVTVDAYCSEYNKGTGTITLDGAAAGTDLINFAGLSVEDIIVNNTVGTTGIKQLSNSVTTDSLTITSGTLDLSTYSMTVTGAASVAGTLKIGASAGTGLITAGLTINSGGKGNFQTTSKISNSGDFSAPNEAWTINNHTCAYTQTGAGAITNPTTRFFYSFKISTGALTVPAGTHFMTGNGSKEFVMEGTASMTLVGSGYIGASGSVSGNNVTIGSGCDITGAGTLFIYGSTTNYVNNRAAAFTASGLVSTISISSSVTFPAWDFSNNNVTLMGPTGAGQNVRITAGVLKCANLTAASYGAMAFTLDNATYNPSFEIKGNVSVNAYVAWSKGAGAITLAGTSGTQTINFSGETVEDIACPSTGGTRSFADGVTADTIIFQGGAINSSVAGARRVLAVTNTSVAANTSFKDISMGSKNRINAKSAGNVNLGNCLGIVFRDKGVITQ
jgi:hypothetical protein